jgi:cytochrome bd-type quinol oxidase subunit 1
MRIQLDREQYATITGKMDKIIALLEAVAAPTGLIDPAKLAALTSRLHESATHLGTAIAQEQSPQSTKP